MSAREFAEWIAYDRLDPIGEHRNDWRFAMLACVLASVFRGKGPAPKIADFMPQWDTPPTPKDPSQIEAMVKMYAAQAKAQAQAQAKTRAKGRK